MLSQVTGAENWWVRAVDGAAAILFGLAALFWPGLTLGVLIALFGIYALVFGAVHLVGTFRAVGANATWWPHLLLGLAGVGAGIVAFAYPGVTALILLYVIAYWAIVVGILELAASFTQNQFWLAVLGIVTVLFGFMLLANPLAGALAYVTLIGVFAVVRGVVELIAAVRAPAPGAAR